MCGRMTQTTDPAEVARIFDAESTIDVDSDDAKPRYNVAPTQPLTVVLQRPDEGRLVEQHRWGLVPSFSKSLKDGAKRINARAETVAEKPSFRVPFRRRRCLVLADGFYEWRVEPGQRTKTPMLIRLKSGKPFAFAGLWEAWHSPEGQTTLSCTIITTTPNELVAKIHNRMPVVLEPEGYELWLDPGEQSPDHLNAWLRPYPAEQMTAYSVSKFVNNPQNDTPDCIVPVTQQLSL